MFALVNWIKVAALPRARPVHAREPVDLRGALPRRGRLDLGRRLLVRRVPGERFYTIVYVLLILVGLKLLGRSGRARLSD